MTLSDISLVLLVLLLAIVVLAGVALSERRLLAGPTTMRKSVLWAAAGMGLWLAGTAVAASNGWLSDTHPFPTPVAPILLPSLILVFILVFGKTGARLAQGLNFEELIALQAFRLPVELILLGYYFESKIPVQMTFEGHNFDVLTAITAVVLAPLVITGSVGRKAIWVWNIFGLGLLINVLGIAVLSAPGAMRIFQNYPPNSLPFHWPSIWILFCVLVALFSHLLIFRKLLKDPQ